MNAGARSGQAGGRGWGPARRLVTSVGIRRGLLAPRLCPVRDPASGRSLQLWVQPESMIEHSLLRRGMYGGWERESLRLWSALAEGAHTVIDIGANTGIYALLAQARNPGATVIAVEPVEANHRVLVRNIEANGFPVRAERAAISDRDGVASMFVLRDRLNYMSSLGGDRYAAHPECRGSHEVVEVEVPTLRFDTLAARHGLGQLSLLKVDVEGHEAVVLQGMLPWIERHRPALIVEVIGEQSARSLQDMFQALDYRFVSIDEREPPRCVPALWDNDSHNFLLCPEATADRLCEAGLVRRESDPTHRARAPG